MVRLCDANNLSGQNSKFLILNVTALDSDSIIAYQIMNLYIYML